MVKSSGGKRESDGAIVLMIAARNAAGGKGPDFGHAGEEVKRKDWSRPLGPTILAGICPPPTCESFQAGYGLRPSSCFCPGVLPLTPGAVTSHLVAVAPDDEMAA